MDRKDWKVDKHYSCYSSRGSMSRIELLKYLGSSSWLLHTCIGNYKCGGSCKGTNYITCEKIMEDISYDSKIQNGEV